MFTDGAKVLREHVHASLELRDVRDTHVDLVDGLKHLAEVRRRCAVRWVTQPEHCGLNLEDFGQSPTVLERWHRLPSLPLTDRQRSDVDGASELLLRPASSGPVVSDCVSQLVVGRGHATSVRGSTDVMTYYLHVSYLASMLLHTTTGGDRMDMAAELRGRMASRRISVADVATMVGRTPVQVSRYRTAQTPIPLDVAQLLYQNDLLPLEALLGRPKDAA